jgi:glycosyltransferase involved in cell wall biosynthesis
MKIAIIKQGGLCTGGIEKYLQQIAIELKAIGCNVDYFYTDAVPCGPSGWIHPGTDLNTKELLERHGIGLFEVKCTDIDALEIGGKWNNSNLFELFNPSAYDVVIGGHKGEPCWPFSEIKGPRIIETVHGTDFTSGTSQYADAYVLISDYQLPRWYARGGIEDKTHVIAPMVSTTVSREKDLRKKWKIPEDKFIFGMHQSARGGLFSGIPLQAFSLIKNDKNFFVMLNGTDEYTKQAKSLQIDNFIRIPQVPSAVEINEVLSCLAVYAHGRFDGEVCSSALIEAMANSLPIVTHPSAYNNGHLSQIENCGFVASSVKEYAMFLYKLQNNSETLLNSKRLTKERYDTKYAFEVCRASLLNLILKSN